MFALKVPFEAGEGIPLELNPTVGRKLAKETLDLAPAHITMKLLRLLFVHALDFAARPVGGNLIESSPVVGFQSKPPESQLKKMNFVRLT